MRNNTSWNDDLRSVMEEHGESFPTDIEVAVPSLDSEEMRRRFDHSYGCMYGCAFTVWTKRFIYFPATYDGAEWIACVSRHPQTIPECTPHVGGG